MQSIWTRFRFLTVRGSLRPGPGFFRIQNGLIALILELPHDFFDLSLRSRIPHLVHDMLEFLDRDDTVTVLV